MADVANNYITIERRVHKAVSSERAKSSGQGEGGRRGRMRADREQRFVSRDPTPRKGRTLSVVMTNSRFDQRRSK